MKKLYKFCIDNAPVISYGLFLIAVMFMVVIVIASDK